MIYVLTIGEYSDLAIRRVVEGKPGLNIAILVKDWTESKFGPGPKRDYSDWEAYYERFREWRKQFNNGEPLDEFIKEHDLKILEFQEADVSPLDP